MANNDTGLFSCRNTTWIVGGLLGLVAFLLILPSWFWAIVVGLVVAVVMALVLQRLFCAETPATSGVGQSSTAAATSAAASPTTTAKADIAAEEKAAAATTSAELGNVDAAAVSTAPAMNADAADASPETPKAAPKPKAPAKKTAAKKPAAKSATKATATKTTATKPAAKPAKAPAKTSTTPKPAKPAAGPELLSGPRSGGADDLKMIKGVGPGIEKKLNDAGVYHFDQIATWKKADIAVMDDKLSFRGRIERDEWIKQAKSLAKGEQTEFSKRASSSGLDEGNKKK